ncbi:MAG: hypothetical protein H0X66_05110 [Verrucomicrobia bacterium]|nr:hypothetical protein [Verrucomicrobiota bacterium]
MRSLASDAKSWNELLVTVPKAFDEHLCFYEGAPWDVLRFKPIAADNLFDEFDDFIARHVLRPYGGPDAVVIPPGNFAKVRPYLGLDEWTYLTGVPCRPESIGSLISRWGNIRGRLDETHFKFVEEQRGFVIAWIDGWWECFFADDHLFEAIQFGGRKGNTEPGKWINGSWRRPDFRAEPSAAPNGGPAASTDNPNAPGGPPSVS